MRATISIFLMLSLGCAPEPTAEERAKAHFMRKFVAALEEVPANRAPNLDYRPLLEGGVACLDCHDEDRSALDPGEAAVEEFRRNPEWMIALMRNWVGRLNEVHGDRLARPVTCADCHARDPVAVARATSGFMRSFVRALHERPRNANPASRWKPLVREPVQCALCHGRFGADLAKAAEEAPRDPVLAADRDFMIGLMERWVSELNRRGGAQLTQAVVCLDCHETHPRR